MRVNAVPLLRMIRDIDMYLTILKLLNVSLLQAQHFLLSQLWIRDQEQHPLDSHAPLRLCC